MKQKKKNKNNDAAFPQWKPKKKNHCKQIDISSLMFSSFRFIFSQNPRQSILRFIYHDYRS